MSFREETIGDCRLILGDCLEVLPTLPKVDAVIKQPEDCTKYFCGICWNKIKTRNVEI